jgi:hypothetical protein
MGYFLALCLGAALLVSRVWNPAPPARFAGLGSGDIPRTVGGYAAGPDDAVPVDVQAALSSATMTSRTYQPLGNGAAVNFVLIGGTDRSALHDPRSCLIGAGMTVQNDHSEQLPGTGIDVRACRATDAGNQAGFDMIYLYLVNGRVVSEATQIRAAMLWSALLGRRGTPVYFLRFTRPIQSDPHGDVQGHAALLQFASAMWKTLQPRLLPSAHSQNTRQAERQARVYSSFCRRHRVS